MEWSGWEGSRLSNIAEMECVRRQNDNSGSEKVLSGVAVAGVVGGSREKGKREKEDYLINSKTNSSE